MVRYMHFSYFKTFAVGVHLMADVGSNPCQPAGSTYEEVTLSLPMSTWAQLLILSSHHSLHLCASLVLCILNLVANRLAFKTVNI